MNFKREQGYSLVEMLAAVAVLGIVSLGVAQLSTQVNENEKRATNLLDRTLISSSLSNFVKKGGLCSELRTTTVRSSYSEITLRNWRYGGLASIRRGTIVDASEIVNLRVRQNLSTTQTVVVSGLTLKKTNLEIELGLRQRGKPNSIVKKYFYSIPVLSRSSGRIERCDNQDRNTAQICGAISGEYNSSTGECQAKSSCKVRGNYFVNTCTASRGGCQYRLGRSLPNPYTGSTSCPSGSVRTLGGRDSISYSLNCGKKCTSSITELAVWYSCLECPSSVENNSSPTLPIQEIILGGGQRFASLNFLRRDKNQ